MLRAGIRIDSMNKTIHIIASGDGHRRVRAFTIPQAPVVGFVVFLGLFILVNFALFVRHASTEALNHATVASWNDRLGQQREKIDQLSHQAREQVLAAGRKLADMQARLLRMEALAERVSEMPQVAGLVEGEFRFDVPAATGGPQSGPGVEDVTASDYFSEIDRLSAQLRVREREMRMLESMLARGSFNNQIAPAARPLDEGWVSSRYGSRIDPITGQPAWHGGVDFSGRSGSDVKAVAGGVVTYAGATGAYGNMVEIEHGEGISTRYAHHESVAVEPGEIVKKGQTIAHLGSTGRSTGPHVHFEVLRDGRRFDPAEYLAPR